MNIRILTIIFLVFISCKNVAEKEKKEKKEQEKIVVDSTELKAKPYKKEQENLISQGVWISTIDSLSTVEIIGKKWFFKYNNVETAPDNYYEYMIHESVFDKENSIIDGNLFLIKESDTLKYVIEYISDKNMDLIYLPRGNYQHFKKK
ncbi:hypothetical protein [Wenyingzhuangia marina]|uniref:Lipoprotein n=1 Tax=Wenyingzhuangia marina TaxID=1195760 RepID=A0A1M5V6W6_9FLAO|nr:hypothetical protein [Wenyingzhuangia marina]GGF73977.1 hypothetical protein GCM10011397_16160 [Wenyingzhuangia marina]SHH70977.1 hypothetical protein SAMN05444281_1562 [Wenyingzhuangia marina]